LPQLPLHFLHFHHKSASSQLHKAKRRAYTNKTLPENAGFSEGTQLEIPNLQVFSRNGNYGALGMNLKKEIDYCKGPPQAPLLMFTSRHRKGDSWIVGGKLYCPDKKQKGEK
jgi:hypothetical protein